MKEYNMNIRSVLVAAFFLVVCTKDSFAQTINLKEILGNTSKDYVVENVQYNNKGNIILSGYYSEIIATGQCVFVAECSQDFKCLNVCKHCFPDTFVKIYRTIVDRNDKIYLSVFKNEVKKGSKKVGLLTMTDKFEEITASINHIRYLYDIKSDTIKEVFLQIENGNLYYNLCDKNKQSICSEGKILPYNFETETGIVDVLFYDQKLFLLFINIASQKYSSVIFDLNTQKIKMVNKEMDYAKLINDSGDVVLVSFYNRKEKKTEVEYCFINSENPFTRKKIMIEEAPHNISNVTLRKNISCIISDANQKKVKCYDIQKGTNMMILLDKNQDAANRILISKKEDKVFLFRLLLSGKEKDFGKIIIEKKDIILEKDSNSKTSEQTP